jgi:hypothetical protein
LNDGTRLDSPKPTHERRGGARSDVTTERVPDFASPSLGYLLSEDSNAEHVAHHIGERP